MSNIVACLKQSHCENLLLDSFRFHKPVHFKTVRIPTNKSTKGQEVQLITEQKQRSLDIRNKMSEDGQQK